MSYATISCISREALPKAIQDFDGLVLEHWRDVPPILGKEDVDEYQYSYLVISKQAKLRAGGLKQNSSLSSSSRCRASNCALTWALNYQVSRLGYLDPQPRLV